jgi:hypothetical protein
MIRNYNHLPIEPGCPRLKEMDDAAEGAVYMFYGCTRGLCPYPVLVVRKTAKRVFVEPYKHPIWTDHISFPVSVTSLRIIHK